MRRSQEGRLVRGPWPTLYEFIYWKGSSYLKLASWKVFCITSLYISRFHENTIKIRNQDLYWRRKPKCFRKTFKPFQKQYQINGKQKRLIRTFTKVIWRQIHQMWSWYVVFINPIQQKTKKKGHENGSFIYGPDMYYLLTWAQ